MLLLLLFVKPQTLASQHHSWQVTKVMAVWQVRALLVVAKGEVRAGESLPSLYTGKNIRVSYTRLEMRHFPIIREIFWHIEKI